MVVAEVASSASRASRGKPGSRDPYGIESFGVWMVVRLEIEETQEGQTGCLTTPIWMFVRYL